MIHERNHGEPECNHRLLGASREIYLLCRKTRSIGEILAHFPNMPEDRVLQFLRMMVEKKLMFEERGRFLSLAVSLRNQSDQADDRNLNRNVRRSPRSKAAEEQTNVL
jgi:hypothetical protein